MKFLSDFLIEEGFEENDDAECVECREQYSHISKQYEKDEFDVLDTISDFKKDV